MAAYVDNAVLQVAVHSCTHGQLAIADSDDVGRCLKAVATIQPGVQIADRALLLGTSRAVALVRCCAGATERFASRQLESLEMAAELDLVAVMAEELAAADAANTACEEAQGGSSLRLSELLLREQAGVGVSIVRHSAKFCLLRRASIYD
eukprot:TRINITY_DN22356_c0_g1_i2.p2 TRINITY_DN22356_c0_g1~~TRINITY_DN22356_c0_g1_i2.p2  ORF type:complete len:150 (+),score=33.19 TRINITY_DN22356_c0_g1_i2:60-509(+)